MKNINPELFGIFICLVFLSFTNEVINSKEIYNKNANKLIFQVIKESSCDCLLEVSNESIVQINNKVNPSFNIRKYLIEHLNLKNDLNLDSLVDLSDNFKMDYIMLKKNNVKIISIDSLKNVEINSDNTIFKMCTKGIIFIRKPIFDKTYKKAALDYNFPAACIKGPSLAFYELKNGLWKRIIL